MRSEVGINLPCLELFPEPTPLEEMPRLARHLRLPAGQRLWIKRDDLTGPGGGGNKIRKLEFLVAEAEALGCDILLTTGALQSNHARQTAAVAARRGLSCLLLLSDRVPGRSSAYHESGNLLLSHLFGAKLEVIGAGIDPAVRVEEIAETLRRQSRKPFIVPLGGSNPLGTLGYVAAMGEFIEQANARGLDGGRIVVATGSGGTHAGLLAGSGGSGWRIEGVSVSKTAPAATDIVNDLVQGAGRLQPLAEAGEVIVTDRFIGQGYGQPTPAMVEAVRMMAQTEGLLLDPVYSGKAFAGLIALLAEGKFVQEPNVVFWHTGGMPGLFAYSESFVDPK